MKLSDLKKIVDDYINEHSPDDEVMIIVDGSRVLSKLNKVALPLLKKYICATKVCEHDEKVVWGCGYQDECIPPESGVAFNDCENCPNGGSRIETRVVPCKKYGKYVLAICC